MTKNNRAFLARFLTAYMFCEVLVCATKKLPDGSSLVVHLTRLELAHPKALPPQGSVYTNFTTGAYGYYITIFKV